MKKRKLQNNLAIQNQSTKFDINDVQIQQFHSQYSQNPQKVHKNQPYQGYHSQLNPKNPDQSKKSCCQSLKEKLEYFWIKMINYLQFDRVLTHEQIELMKREDFIIKTKYPDNYFLTYQERSKSFGITIDEVTRMKMQEEEIKQKNCWEEFKRFICCQGGNQLEENDEMLTAASQSEYFYLTRAKYNQKSKVQLTEQALLEKPHSKMVREEKIYEEQIITKHIIKKKVNQNIFEQEEQINEEKNKFSPKKQIDLNNVKIVNKKTTKNHQTQILENQEEDTKKNQHQKNIENQEITKFKETQKVFIKNREKQNLYEQQVSDEVNLNKNNFSNITNNHLNSTSQTKDQSSVNPSPNPSLQKLTPHAFKPQDSQFNLQGKSPKMNPNKNFNYFNLQDDISVTKSQTNNQPQQNQKIRKRNKKERNKSSKQLGFQNLKVIQNVNDQNQLKSEEQDIAETQDNKSHSFSTQQLKKKSRKRNFNMNQFDESIEQDLKDEQIKMQNSLNIQFGGNNDTIISDSSSTVQLAKKKKARNKKLFNLKEEDEKNEEIIIFEQNEQSYQQNQNDSNAYAHTIDLADLSSQGISSTSNMKKRKKNKKLRESDMFGDEENVVVIEDEQIIEQNTGYNKEYQQPNNGSTLNLDNLQNHKKAEKKRKKKARLREQVQKQQQQFDFVDLGEIN